jgi:ethanolamine ammonia-lyase large subunit
MACDGWLALENHFLGNRETRALHIDTIFQSFVQGDLSVNDYYQKIKGFTDSLVDLGVDVTDHVLVLNVLRGLNKNIKHLRTIFTDVTPSPSFQKVLDDLYLEEIQ